MYYDWNDLEALITTMGHLAPVTASFPTVLSRQFIYENIILAAVTGRVLCLLFVLYPARVQDRNL